MRHWILLAILILSGANALSAAAAEKEPDYPQNVVLQAKEGGRYLLTWDPIFNEDLMGYSIWMRKKGAKEFTRLSVPVKVGKEVQKQPMTTEARLELKLGEGRKDLEFSVLAEYEDGPSERSESVFSAQALPVPSKVAVPLVSAEGAEPAVAAPALGSAAEAQPAKADPYAEDDLKKQPEVAPWAPKEGLSRPLLSPPGELRVELGAEFQLQRFRAAGKSNFMKEGYFYNGNYIGDGSYFNWKNTAARRTVVAPLRVNFGILPSLELGAELRFQSEHAYAENTVIHGMDVTSRRLYLRDVSGTVHNLPEPSNSGIGDSTINARVMPWESVPLVLGLGGIIPTGRSRVRSTMDWSALRPRDTGFGAGVLRLLLSAQVGGESGTGFAFKGSYLTAATEAFTFNNDYYVNSVFVGTLPVKHAITHGAVAEFGGSYSIPWVLLGRDGSVALELLGRSKEADRWSMDGQDIAPSQDESNGPETAAFYGIQFYRDDQLELGFRFRQKVSGRYEAGGKLSYTMHARGEALNAALLFSY